MEISRSLRRLAAGVLAATLLAAGFVAFAPSGAGAQSGGATVKVVAPDAPVKEGDEPIELTVSADGVTNFGGFQFILLYDDSIFSYDSYQKGDFLGSTGREVVCNDVSDAGAFKLNCVSFRPTPAGADGGGVLATVKLKPTGSGSSEIALDRVRLIAADESATEIPLAGVTNVTIDVEGSSSFNWLLWGPIIAVGALAVVGAIAFGAMRMSRGGKPAAAM